MLGTHPVLLYLDLVRQGHWNHGTAEIFQSQRRQQRQEGQSSYSLRPVDLLFFTVSLRQMESSMSKIERSGRNLCAFAYDILSVLYSRAEKSFALLRLDTDVKWAPPSLKSESVESSLDVRKLEETANQFNLDSEEQQLVMPIDVLFGSMIVINGAFVGIQATQEDDNTLIYWIDLGFTIIFTIEFILRGILQAGLIYVHQSEDTDTDFNFFEQANRKVSRFSRLRSRMRCWIFPPCPPGGFRSVLAAMCWSLKELVNLRKSIELFIVRHEKSIKKMFLSSLIRIDFSCGLKVGCVACTCGQ